MSEPRQIRSSRQRERILELLLERGSEGVTNVELNEVCFRYGARIWELRRAGHNIHTANLGEGLFRFTLISSQSPNSNGVGEDATSGGDKPTDRDDYARRTRKALPLFAGVAGA